MSLALIGGLLLIVGAWFVYQGNIFRSVIIYFVADICWVMIALYDKDYLGAVFIFVGMTLGLLAYLKMNSGKMRKDLKHD